MTLILRNTPGTLELKVYKDGTLTDLDADPTIAVTDANGNAVTTGAVTKPASTTGIYRSVLPGQANLNRLTAVWTGLLSSETVKFAQVYEIAGNLLFTEAEARATTITGLQTPLADETDHPDSAIARMRALITDQFEWRTGRSWIRRYARMELSGTGTAIIDLTDGRPRASDGAKTGGPGRLRDIVSLISVTIEGTAATLSDIAIDGRQLIHTNGVWTRASVANPFNVIVEYEYGPDPVPLEAAENGLRMAVANLEPSDVSAWAQTFAGEDGSTNFGPNGLAWPTKVWEWLKKHRPVLI